MKNSVRWFAVLFATLTPVYTAKYPQDALKCVASLKEPDGKLICPKYRNAHCVKEVSTLKKEDCGRTSFFGDKWNMKTGECEYQKCGDSCEKLSWDFEFDGELYERNRFCCRSDYCNGSTPSSPVAIIVGLAFGIMIVALLA